MADLRTGPPSGPGSPVAYAAREVASGAVLTEGDVAVTELAPDSPLRPAALLPGDVVGRTVVGDLAPGEMITAARIVDDGARAGLATMPVAFDDNALASFLVPGMSIDVVWSSELSGRGPEVVVRGARVLRVGAGPDGSLGPGSGTPVLLELQEADAVRLAAAQGSGSLSVLVR